MKGCDFFIVDYCIKWVNFDRLNKKIQLFALAIPIKCFDSHRLVSCDGGSVGREKKGRMNTSKGLGSREGRAAKARGRMLEACLALTIY